MDSGNDVTQTGAATVTGNANFDTDTVTDVTLTNASNNFASISSPSSS